MTATPSLASDPAALPAPPREPQAVCQWACEALAAGRAREALEAFAAAQKPAENHPAVAATLALLDAEIDRWDAARDHARLALAADPANPLAGGIAAIANWRLQDRGEALRLFQIHGLFAAYPLVRIFVWTFAEDVRSHPDRYPWPSGEDQATRAPAASAAPVPAPAWWKRLVYGGGFSNDSAARALCHDGDRALVRGNLADALAAFEAAAVLDPRNWSARMAAGLSRIELGDSKRAADELVTLLGENPDVPNLAAAAAWALICNSEHQHALDILSTLTPAGPDDWTSNYLAALAFHGLGYRNEADRALQQALGPFFLDTWEQFIQPLFHRVLHALRREMESGDDRSREAQSK